MTYSALRTQHFGMLTGSAAKRVSGNPSKAERAHRACLRVAGRRGAQLCVDDPRKFAQMVRAELGLGGLLGGLLGGIFQQLLLQLIKDILPLIIAWLTEQLGGLVTFHGEESLEKECLRLAEDGR